MEMIRNKRLAISLTPDIKSIYEKTAGLMGIPASTFISTLLTESAPSIKAMQKPLRSALKDKQHALTGISELIDDLKEEATEHQDNINDTIKNGNKEAGKGDPFK
jgi:hypothetical protein